MHARRRHANTISPSLILNTRECAFYLGLLFERAAHRFPEAEITLDHPVGTSESLNVTYSYAELADHVADLAARLQRIGVKPGEHVAIHKDDNFDIPLLACAAARVGAVPVLMSSALEPLIVERLLARLDDPWLVTNTRRLNGELGVILKARGIARTILAAGDAVADAIALADYGSSARAPAIRMHKMVPALITHTSGTTGVPKLMVHCAEALWHRLLPQQLIAYPIRHKERIALCMSFVHSRFYHSLGVFLGYGNPLAVLVDYDPDHVRAFFARWRPGLVETHPNNFVDWEELADAPDGPLASVRYYSSTFDAIHPRTMQRLLQASKRRAPLLIQLYGQSETGPITGWFYTRRSIARIDGRCVGVALPGFIRLRAVDEQGRRLPRNKIGHLEVRSRGRVLTYVGEHERYLQQAVGDWWRLGDMGYLDYFGRLHLTDRAIDRIEAIESNLEVEDKLLERLPELREVIIVPNEDGQPQPIVATRKDAALDAERWAEAVVDLRELLEPIQWAFDDFPRTSTWKVRRLEIRARLQAERIPNDGSSATV
jgi:acyl-coenzyme A synthetase/AMP-(fatty) acid ligase